MNPFYFGAGERRIFGIYEPAAGGGSGRHAAVVCAPWGVEYLYAHRTLRALATKLSMAGHHTLRFDYFGTGDSAGDMLDADLAGWEGDVESAIESLEDIVGGARVTLIGLRLGANIAAQVAARLPKRIGALILWDPIVSGGEYLRSLGVDGPPLGEDALQVDGFPLTRTMMREFLSVDLGAPMAALAARSLMLVTERLPSHDSLPLPAAAAPGDATGSLAMEFLSAPCPWIGSATLTGIVPARVIQRIVDWLG